MIEIEEDKKLEMKEISNKKPYWYKIGLTFSIAPIVISTIIFILLIKFVVSGYLRITIFDLIFSELNILSFFSIAFLIISSKIYKKNKTLSIILLLFPFVSFCLYWLYFYYC